MYLQRIQHAEMMRFWQAGGKDAERNHAQTKALRQDALFKSLGYTPPS